MFYFKSQCLALGAILFPCAVVFAQQSAESSLLSEVQVSAPKYPQKLSQTGKVISLISRAQLDQMTGKSLAEVLQSQVGISVNGARSAPGSNQEIYVRGANTGHVLLLIDGFPVNDPSHISQVMDWNLLDISSLERIEILKGGQSTLYGSDAMAGVINLVTQKTSTKQVQGNVQVQAGTIGELNTTAQIRGSIAKNQWNVQVRDFVSQGYSAAKDTVGNYEKDGFRQQQVHLAWSRPMGQKSWLEVYYQWNGNKSNLDAGPFVDERDYTAKANSSSIRLQYQYRGLNTSWYLRAFHEIIHREFKNDSTFIAANAWTNFSFSTYHGKSQGLEWYGKWSLGNEFVLLAGTEYRYQNTSQSDYSISAFGRYDSPSLAPEKANQSIWATYATLQKNWQMGGIEVGTRWNKSSNFGDFTTFNINPYVFLSTEWKLFANGYTGFKVPSLYQLYSPYGNSALKPELGSTIELGISYLNADWSARVVGFQNQVRDGIVFQSKNVDPYGQYVNVSKQSTQGLELEGAYRRGAFNSSLNYTFLDGSMTNKFAGKDSTYSSLIRRPAHALVLNFGLRLTSHWQVSLLHHWQARRTDFVYDEALFSVVAKELSPYVWAELQSSFELNKHFHVNLIIKNLYNQKFIESYGYATQPLNAVLVLKYRW
ncbi:TonB-dependent receptor plug domain-containing protein [Aquirufa aurantiipilula]|uniref:TonB-dependent receptor plug domain-containing protein n=1 Tax=Aquirufa aurantiipilula TaxID=2696561 RepID=UPI001CAA7B3C|nr:TonB-dependent receptor [Aquirufa aurantiipilula]MBZ1326311.1 TonB-dependent receptor [Aquirufa aurantiipilula]